MRTIIPDGLVIVPEVPIVLYLMERTSRPCARGSGGVEEDGEWGNSGGAGRREGGSDGGVSERREGEKTEKNEGYSQKKVSRKYTLKQHKKHSLF
jgi:hypothetical protein